MNKNGFLVIQPQSSRKATHFRIFPMSVVFIGTPTETFTPTQSGAIATIIWELSKFARGQQIEPWALLCDCETAPFPLQNFVPIACGGEAQRGFPLFKSRLERKVLGWTHVGGRAFAGRVVAKIASHQLHQLPLVVSNEPDLAVELRRKFPQAHIFHWFHNQLSAKSRTQAALRTAVNGSFAVSDFTSRWIEEFYGYQTGEVQTLYNGVDLDHFRPALVPVKGVPIINFVGRTGIEKAPDLLLKACLELSQKTTDFAVQIVGSNHWNKFEMDDYQREIASLTTEVEKRGIVVNRVGHMGREMLPEVIRRAHIHVVPSRWDEAFGLTTIEGMACGLATIGSATGGTPEVIGDAGLLFERDNIAQLTAYLELLVRDEAMRLDYAHRARERAQQFSWQKCWDNFAALTSPR